MADDELFNLLDTEIPDRRVYSDVRRVLDEAGNVVHLDTGQVSVGPDDEIDIISKSLTLDRFDAFLTPIRVEIAIGGIASDKTGILLPGKCFSVLHYDKDLELVTVDFSSALP